MEGYADTGALVRLTSISQSTLLPSSYYNVASLLRQSFLTQSELCDVTLNCIGNRDATGEGIAEVGILYCRIRHISWECLLLIMHDVPFPPNTTGRLY
jgi:hypothetical protein